MGTVQQLAVCLWTVSDQVQVVHDQVQVVHDQVQVVHADLDPVNQNVSWANAQPLATWTTCTWSWTTCTWSWTTCTWSNLETSTVRVPIALWSLQRGTAQECLQCTAPFHFSSWNEVHLIIPETMWACACTLSWGWNGKTCFEIHNAVGCTELAANCDKSPFKFPWFPSTLHFDSRHGLQRTTSNAPGLANYTIPIHSTECNWVSPTVCSYTYLFCIKKLVAITSQHASFDDSDLDLIFVLWFQLVVRQHEPHKT